MTEHREIRHFHLFCGLGGGAKGFNKAQPRIPGIQGRMRCIGGIDVDPAGIADFSRLAGVQGTVLDLFDRSQYRDFHGAEPPAAWQEASPADIQQAAGNERPHIVFLSAPCKGFSGLLSETRSKTTKYQALNRLTVRGVWLMLEAFGDDPPEFVLFENVPRIQNRGAHLLSQITSLLEQYGYAVAGAPHDCGELGGLGQSRKRYLLVARHREKVPPFLYEPPKLALRSVGEIIGRLPVPGDGIGGPMHRMPQLAWKTWVRLAFVEAGSDWRSLNRLTVENGLLRDYLVVPKMHDGMVTTSISAAFAIADPRFDGQRNDYMQYGVIPWGQPTGAMINVKSPGQGKFAVADPRHFGPSKHGNEFRVVRRRDVSRAVTGGHGPSQCVADPRGGTDPAKLHSKYEVATWDGSARTVISGSNTGQGAFAVADPRPGLARDKGDHYLTAGHYGVTAWDAPSGAVSAAAGHDNGRWSVADPREPACCFDVAEEAGAPCEMPGANDKLAARIVAEDRTWHRPFTTLELAALQSLVDPEEWLELEGLSDSAWRERIGNAVPPDAAQAIGEEIGRTLLLAWAGETFQLSATPLWVRNIDIAMSLDVPQFILGDLS
ncbi:DNA cytosine methyltransferase [Thiomonas bhubaneswarensis]|uniref:C-5 cytosine-specific DNA methylase n=1 Tax=Thiomonas bhubaneswarensis TaxID=339866 RepID=A0A0K6I1P0_9BURK|nr:DNA cytosine methyltransferase [Thiomonas bhubaneswarensis]CUA96978.1 C-5 cytosine-specific DNA methylase [Thiomonas bhubaneswarensis]